MSPEKSRNHAEQSNGCISQSIYTWIRSSAKVAVEAAAAAAAPTQSFLIPFSFFPHIKLAGADGRELVIEN